MARVISGKTSIDTKINGKLLEVQCYQEPMIKGAGNFNAVMYIWQISKVGVVSLVTYVFPYKIRAFGGKLGQKSMLLHRYLVLL